MNIVRFNLIFFVLYFMFQVSVFAQSSSSTQSNFSISPPPIPWFEFEEKQKDLKYSGTYISLSGNGMSFWGVGGSCLFRYAFNNYFALDVGGNIMYLNGEISSGSDTIKIDGIMMSAPLDIEFQPIKTSHVSLLLFAGVYGNYNSFGNDDISTEVYMYGPQGGAQLSLKFSDFALTPFFMFQNLRGKSTVTFGYGTSYETSYSTKIPAYNVLSYGFDITYAPWNLTLSSILQINPSTGDNKGFKTYIFTLGFDKKWLTASASSGDTVKSNP